MLPNGTGRLDAEITIRRAESIADYRACQEAQRQAWGISEEGYVIPVATMVGANLHGGMVIGAFRSGGQAVGMSFGFLGRVGERICLYSQLTGVVPAYQSRGVGHALKLVQRYLARAEGLDLIAWAFDPLQAGNAHFNLDRLGAAAGRYVDNMYGERTDALNAGVPTDRLIAEWDLETSPGPRALPDPDVIASLPRLIRTGRDHRGQLEPLGVESQLGGAPRFARDPRADCRSCGRIGRTWPKPGERPSERPSPPHSPWALAPSASSGKNRRVNAAASTCSSAPKHERVPPRYNRRTFSG